MWLYVEGAFRTRQFSYLIEMLSFKFWSALDTGYVRNYTVIGLHILNTVLAGMLVWLLTKRKWAGWLCAAFLLNSGAAIATLVFPLRNAKILVVTLFLLAWIVLARAKGRFCDEKSLRIWGFFTLLFLACFTDEYAAFLISILFVYLVVRDGWRAVFTRRFLKPVVTMTVLFSACVAVFYTVSRGIEQGESMGAFQDMLGTLKAAYAGGSFLIDIPRAFFGYFLRRNFGYWDFTLPGMLAAAAFAVLIYQLFRHSSSEHRRLCLAIGAVLLVKAVALPHNSGHHNYIMPDSAVFPSLLYFSYYYVYMEAVLLAVIIWLLLGPKGISDKKAVLFLCLALFIGLSNTLHLKRGPKDLMTFHEWDDEFQFTAFERMIGLKDIIRDERYQPLYLSFPSAEKPLFDAKDPHQIASFYIKPILIMYLKDIEQSRAVVSLENVVPDRPVPREEELVQADYFYDLVKGRMINLGSIRLKAGPSVLRPFLVHGQDRIQVDLQVKESDRSILLFVKGSATIDFVAGGETVSRSFQIYGYSYQAFLLDVRPPKGEGQRRLEIVIAPKEPEGELSVVGPLTFPQSSGEIFRDFPVPAEPKNAQ
ncbi:MAG: hypothetical protein U9Q07_03605 [Planctomycetota bacterium]|nr:hypothetical protein [Planctomycetota bacterium]